ncbi:MAG TPA: hypothetical protein VLX58_03205 [Bryobacteraceae bacterium]|nr:hypothetical protein [Bryobacteraceae bacterium]
MRLDRWTGAGDVPGRRGKHLAAVRAHLTALRIAAATLTAGGILAIVALHMLTD